MRTFISRLAIAVTFSIIMVSVINAASLVTGKIGQHRTTRTIPTQLGPEIIGSSYCEMMNNLFATSGR